MNEHFENFILFFEFNGDGIVVLDFEGVDEGRDLHLDLKLIRFFVMDVELEDWVFDIIEFEYILCIAVIFVEEAFLHYILEAGEILDGRQFFLIRLRLIIDIFDLSIFHNYFSY